MQVLPADADSLADALLLRVLARIDAAFPDLVGRLFFPEEEEDELDANLPDYRAEIIWPA